jgi:type II secretory pathway component PulK
VNNAVARVAALLAVAVMTIIVAGSATSPNADVLAATDRDAFHRGFRAAMIVAAACAALGGALVGAALGSRARDATPRA